MSVPATGFAPIHKTLEIDRPVDAAFRLFVEGMHRWWPLASHSVGGPAAVWCGIEPGVGGRVYERTGDGTEHLWGTVTAWQPPYRVAFTWHPGRPPQPATEVEVSVADLGGGRCRVDLVHRGWEALGERAADALPGYVTGWDLVLVGRFGGLAAAGG